jgi:hypothetical protein
MKLGLMMALVGLLVGGFAMTPSYGAADTTTLNFKNESETVLTSLCKTPEITMSMNLHFRFHETINANWEIIQQTGLNSFNSHGKDQGVS